MAPGPVDVMVFLTPNINRIWKRYFEFYKFKLKDMHRKIGRDWEMKYCKESSGRGFHRVQSKQEINPGD